MFKLKINDEGSIRPKAIAFIILVIIIIAVLFLYLGKFTYYSWDEIQIEKYKPLITNINESPPDMCYARITSSNDGIVITYFFYWFYQDVDLTGLLSHLDDWEPIFVYLKDDKVDKVAFDQWHYRVGRDTDPVCLNNHVLIEFIDDWRAISTVDSAGNYYAGLNYSVAYLEDVYQELIDYGFKEEILKNPWILWDTWLLTNQYKHNDMWDRKEKYNPER